VTLIVLGLAWLSGIAAVALWNAPPWLTGVAFAGAVPFVLQRVPGVRPWLLAGAVVFALAGGWRFGGWQSSPLPDLAKHVGDYVELTGVVRDLPRPGITTTRFEVEIREVISGEQRTATSGAVMVTLPQYTRLEPGSTVSLSGRLDEPPVFEDFDYRAYLARRGVVGTMFFPALSESSPAPKWSRRRIVGSIRGNLEDGLVRTLPEPTASVAAGISLGRPGNVPAELYDDYRRAGLAHVLAVSGAHVSVLSGLVFFGLVQMVGRRRAIWPALLVVAAYVLLAGAPFSVVRAGIMASIFLVGIFIGRQQAGLAALAAAAIVMTAVRPATALDLGFQLSLSATAGLIVFAPWIRACIGWAAERAHLRGLVPPLAEHVAALSLAATIATAPLLWVNFGQVPIVSPISNIAVEPVFALAFALSLATAFAAVSWEPAGWMVGLLAYYPVSGLNFVATSFGSLPYASISVPRASATWALAAYALLAVPGWYAYRYLAPIPERPPIRRGEQQTRRMAVGAACGGMAVLVAWHSLLPVRGPGTLELTMLNVGQGDALLVTTPSGSTVLVDGGPSGIVLVRELGAVLPHWTRRVDKVVLTHPEADHLGGLPELGRRYRAGEVFDNGTNHPTMLASLYAQAFPERQALHAGESFEVDGVRFEVLWPAPDFEASRTNDLSVVLRVEYGDIVILMTGDVEFDAQHALADRGGLEATVLKVPHHGAATSSRRFFAAVGAPLALISAGEDNRYGHPAQVTLNQLDGASIYRTDVHGRVTIRTDGQSIEMHAER
jgi:competence protein ComEC